MSIDLSTRTQSRTLASWVFQGFLMLLPNMIVLNLPQFNLKLAGIGMGAFFIYVSFFTLFFSKFFEMVRRTLKINRSLLCLLSLVLLLVQKQLQSNQPLNRFFGQFAPFVLVSLAFLLGQVFVKREQDRRLLVKVLLINTIIGSLIGLVHFYFFPQFQLYDSTANEGEYFSVIDYESMKVRECSTYSTPVAYSHNMTFGIIFLLSQLTYRQFKVPRSMTFIMLGIAVFGVYVSYSRAAILFLCMYGVYSFVDKGKGLTKYVVISVLGMLGVAAYSLLGILSGRFSLSAENLSGEIRWLKWYIAIKEIFASVSNFLLGINLDAEVTMDGVSFSDNYYILHQLRFGLLGLIILGIAGWYIYRRIRLLIASNLYLSEFDAYYVNAVSVIGCAALFFAFFSNILLMVPTNIYLPIFMGSIWNIKRVAPE